MAEAFDPDKFLADTAPVAQGGRISPTVIDGAQGFDADKFLSETAPQVDPKDPYGFHRIASSPTQEDKRSALQGAGQILDYPGGLVRTALAGAAGLVAGQGIRAGTEPLVNGKDVSDAFHGKAPSTAEYLKRAGVPEGPSTQGIPLVGQMLPKITTRDAVGFAGDVATDPLTYVSKGVKALSPLSEGAESAGRSAYKSGFKKIDEKLLEKGKAPLSDLMLENGVKGSTKDVSAATQKIGAESLAERSSLYDKADKLGVTVDMGFPLENAEATLEKMRSNPGQRELADKLSEFMNLYKKEGKVPLSKLSEWKSALYNSLPSTAFDGPKLKGPAKEFEKALASDFKDAIVDAGNTAEKGLGDSIDKLNERLGTVISARKPLAQQVSRGNTTNAVTSVDAILSGHPGLLGVKKGADIAKTTAARTRVGSGLMDIGKSGLLDQAARRGLVNSLTPKRPSLLVPQGGLFKMSGDE